VKLSVPLRSFLLATLFLPLALPAAEGPRPTFLFGGDYPDKPSAAVSSLFYESGLNCIRITGGGYAWALPTHKPLAAEMEKHAVQVYLQLGSHYPDSEYFKLKEAWLVDHKGETGVEDRNAWAVAYSGSFWPQYSYTTDVFRRKLEGDFKKYTAEFQAFKNVSGVILHNEPGYHWLKDRVFDYSPPSIAKFKEWLAQRHGDVATLNQRWGSNYASFDEVVPPPQPPLAGPQIPAWLDWRRFHVTAIADFLAWESAYVKSLNPAIPRTTNLDGPINNWYPYRLAHLEAYSRAMDAVGIDIYPTEWTKRGMVAYSMDMAKGVAQGRPVHVLECETFSEKKWRFPEEDRARLLRSQFLTMIGHEAEAVLMWGFSRNDDFSLTNGEFNPRVRETRDLAFTAKTLELNRFRRLPSRVALVVDTDTFVRVSATEKMPLAASSRVDVELVGYYLALRDAGYQADVIFLEQLAQKEEAARYEALVLPTTELMDAELAATLRKYVEGGGTLLASGRFAEADRWSRPAAKVPAEGLDSVFGLSISGPAGTEGVMMNAPALWLDGPIQKVALAGAEALGKLEDGTPGLTVNSLGKGKAFYLNGMPGNAHHYDHDGKLPKILAQVLGKVRPDLLFEGAGQLELSALREAATGNVLVIGATHGEEGKLPPRVPAGRLKIAADGRLAAVYKAAYAFTAPRLKEGRWVAGPEPVTLAADGAELPAIDSALPVLLVRDGRGPLVTVNAPAQVAPGANGTLVARVYNPSPEPLVGEVAVAANPHLLPLPAEPAELRVEPWSSAETTVVFRALDPTERTPLQALFKTRDGAKSATANPVDVAVK
jgi:hypothetical protein